MDDFIAEVKRVSYNAFAAKAATNASLTPLELSSCIKKNDA